MTEEEDDDDLLCAYLLRFGIETMNTLICQEGEVEFLNLVSQNSTFHGSTHNAWQRITEAYRRRMESKAQP